MENPCPCRSRFASMRRREFMAGAVSVCILPKLAGAADSQSLQEWGGGAAFDAWVREQMKVAHIPGLALAIVDGGKLVRTAAFGWADLAQRRPMQNSTLINIGSVTKVITGAAGLQLWERNKFRLDDDINTYLPFEVRNPAHRGTPITFRQLLIHTSSIADGPAYDASYACGDAQVPLGTWLRDYFTSDAKANFHTWAPGAFHGYSNVAYGLLGYLVEVLAGVPYDEYCIRNIFAPLRMSSSRFRLAGMDPRLHATPYTYATDDKVSAVQLRDPSWLPPTGAREGVWVPHCLYSFATAPDGLARSSADDLVRLLLAFINRGEVDGARILQADTVKQMLVDQRVVEAQQRAGADVTLQGLTWHAWTQKYGPKIVWGHTGADPGVKTLVAFRPSDGRGVVVLGHARSGPDAATAIAARVFSYGGA